MGCDIHSVAQVKRNNQWITVESKIGKDARDYELFGLLAGVRGWSEPIHEPRGVPSDFDMINQYHTFYDKKIFDTNIFYMGEHTYSYYTLEELNDVYDKQNKPCETCGRYKTDDVIRADLTWIISHLNKIKEEYIAEDSDIRLVFGFDS